MHRKENNMQNQLNQNVRVDLNAVPPVKCTACGHKFFKVVYLIKKLSALVSPTGKETLVPIQVFACDKCSEVSELFKNLNDTDEINASEGETLGDAVQNPPPAQAQQKPKLFMGS
jgi:predicted nucleic acid-binding Zn ribbon protein